MLVMEGKYINIIIYGCACHLLFTVSYKMSFVFAFQICFGTCESANVGDECGSY